MKRNPVLNLATLVACLVVIGIIGWRAGAESTGARLRAEPTSVAIVNVEKALNDLAELADLNTALKVRRDKRQQDLDALYDRIKGLDEELKLQPENATEKRRELRAQIFELTETGKARTNAYQSLINIEKGEIIRPLYTKLVAGVGEVAAKEGYDLVLFDNRALEVPLDTQAVINEVIQQKSILYADERLDITDQVIVLMNNKYKAGAN
jgi:Skp family chaperone for outer membrane proteins